MSGATPRPWTVTHRTVVERTVRIAEHFAIAPVRGPTLAFLPDGRSDIQAANAALIVRAVNSYDALVEACEMAANIIDPDAWYDDSPTGPGHQLMGKLFAALKLAKGGGS